MTDITVCGLWENELVKKGIMKKGRCRDCLYYDGDGNYWVCSKLNKTFEYEKQNCSKWSIDIR